MGVVPECHLVVLQSFPESILFRVWTSQNPFPLQLTRRRPMCMFNFREKLNHLEILMKNVWNWQAFKHQPGSIIGTCSF